MSIFLKVFTYLVPTIVLLSITLLLRPVFSSISAPQWQVIEWIPLPIFIASMSLCVRFNRSRMFFMALAATISYVYLQWVLPNLSGFTARTSYGVFAISLPALLLFFIVIKEKGIFTLRGTTRFALFLIPIVMVLVISYFDLYKLGGLIFYQFTGNQFFTLTPVPQMALVVIAVGGFLLNGYLFVNPSAQLAAFLGVFISSVLLLHDYQHQAAALLFCSTAGILLVAAVIQESYSMAYLDELTGLPGRRALNEELQKLGNKYTLAMVDIDHFKKFNDTYGHGVGDQVLRKVAAQLASVGMGGKAFRLGGEEFCLVFASKPVGLVGEEMEKLCKSIANSRFALRRMEKANKDGKKQRLFVTISIGVAEREEGVTKPWSVVKAADQALYRAKSRGRNRVSI